ncbi:hypothetical protein D3C79_721300 [compost metagenome]
MAGADQPPARRDAGELVGERLPGSLGLQPLPVAPCPRQPVIPHAQAYLQRRGVEVVELVAGGKLQASPLAAEAELVVVGALQDPAVGPLARVLTPQGQLEIMVGIDFGQLVPYVAEPVAVTHREAAALTEGHGEVGLVLRQAVPSDLAGTAADQGQQQILPVQPHLDPGLLGRPLPAGLLFILLQPIDLTGALPRADLHPVDRDGQGVGIDEIAQGLALQLKRGGQCLG